MKTIDLVLAKAILNKEIAERLVEDFDITYFGCNNSAVLFLCISFLLKNEIEISLSSVMEYNNAKDRDGFQNYLLLLMRETPFVNYEYCRESLYREHSRELIAAHAKDIIKLCASGGDVGEIIDKIQEAHESIISSKADDYMTVADYAKEGCENLFRDNVFVKTGIARLDAAIKGFGAGQLVIIAARPAMGKSTLGLQIACNLEDKALFYCLEMTGKENFARLVASRTGLTVSDIIVGRGDKDKIKQGENSLKTNGLGLVDNKRYLNQIVSHAKKEAKKREIKAVFVDYLQIVKVNSRKQRYEVVGEISRGLKDLAMDLKCPVIAFSQLNRALETENRKPCLADLRESGDIEQDADIIIFIHSEDSKEKAVMDVELILAKGRNFGIGSCQMKYDKPRFVFRDETAADYEMKGW